MIEPRIYRAAFVPALLAVVLTMFSLESRPRPVPQGLAADVLFDGEQAASEARRIATEHPDRRAGRPGDLAVAADAAERFAASGFAVERQRFEAGGEELVNVIARRAGRSRQQVVVVAARDATGVPDAAGSAADTAALIEIAEVFEGRPSRKTLILASVDGSALGDVGVTRLLDEIDGPDLVDAVLVLSGLGAGPDEPPAIVPWSNDTTRGGIGLQRTVAESLRQEVGPPAAAASPWGQLARLAFPLGIGGQGVLIAEGYDAVRISGDGELSESAADAPVDEERLDGLGRAALRTVTALDQGPRPERGPRTYVTIAGQVMPGWVLAVLAATLILPVLAASVDALARARRRRAPVVPWLRWIALGVAPFAVGYALALALSLAGATPDPPPAPVAPSLFPLDGPAIAVLAVVLAAVAVTWLLLRRFLGPALGRGLDETQRAGAGVAVSLALSVAGLALLAIDPFAALIAAPALHLWMLAVLIDPPPARRVRVGLIAGGLVLPALLAIYQLFVLGVGPLGGAWYLLLLVLGGQVGVAAAFVGALFAAILAALVALARVPGASPGPPGAPIPPSTRGPLSYAGPGSLGGTDSALRR